MGGTRCDDIARCAIFCIALGCVLGLCNPSAVWSQGVGSGGVLGLQVSTYFESGEVEDDFEISTLNRSDAFDYENDSSFSLALSYMLPWTESLRWGGHLRYYGSYALRRLEEDDEGGDPEPGPRFVMGPLVELSGVGEWLVPLTGTSVSLVFSGQLGLAMLIPDEDLQDQNEALNDEGIEVFDGPRVGLMFGVGFGVSYPLTRHLALRADYMFQGEEIALYDTEDVVSGIQVRRESSVGVLRHHLGVAVEYAF